MKRILLFVVTSLCLFFVVIAEKNLILVKGGIPGANKSTVVIRNAVKA